MFAWLQEKCGLEDDEEHNLISFIRGLRPEIVEKMNDTKNIHEAYWEAIRVERMLKKVSSSGRYSLRRKVVSRNRPR